MSWSLSSMPCASVLIAIFVPWRIAACAWMSLRSNRQELALISSATWFSFAAIMSCCISGFRPLRFATSLPVGCPMMLTCGFSMALTRREVALSSSCESAACGEATTTSSCARISSE